ncbi:MAG: glycine cleavage system aminomethyltransferase GcvT [Saprospirales bacterium]|nr:MAG: glycine cleavage system aminomethyltransferase GcvT [Saprospirales bacterium]
MKKTPLYEKHLALGAKMTPFAGFEMPVVYTGITEEHLAVRNQAGMFDVSHMGEFLVKGKESLELVQHLTSNDAAKLFPGRIQYSCFPNERGGIIDDLLVYRLADEDGSPAFMLVVNGANIEKDWAWVNANNKFDAELTNVSDQTALIALQGPKAGDILSSITPLEVAEMPYYHFKKGEVAGLSNILVSTTGYTGSGGFEIYAANDQIGPIWDALMEAGEKHGLKPTGLGSRDTLRLEMGFCLFGNDITDETSPIEAGLGWITKLKKGDFIGSDKIKELKEKGIKRKLTAFTISDRRVPRHGYPIYNESEEKIGEVTSGTQSPSLGHPIGLGYIDIDYAIEGNPVFVGAGRKMLKAQICKLPFYKNA